MDIRKRVAQYIADNELLADGERLVAGVSGGPDSLALYVLLQDLGYKPIAAYFDHALRPESAEEARAVDAMIRGRGGEFRTRRADVAEAARREKWSLEEAARALRYQFLVATARECGCRTIAVGHTADDQAETVLLHLLRGAGAGGLRGMLPSTDMHEVQRAVPPGQARIVRPLLALGRAESEAICREAGLTALIDPSNYDRAFLRNRVRHELLPMLETYNPAIRRLLAQTAELMGAHSTMLGLAIERGWEKSVEMLPAETLRIDRTRFAELPLIVQQGVAHEALGRLLGGREDLAHRHVAGLLRFLANPPRTGRARLVKTIELHSAGPSIYLRATQNSVQDIPVAPLVVADLPSHVEVPGFDARLDLEVESPPREAVHEMDAWRAWVDADQLTLPLTVRRAQAADRFWPLGGIREGRLADFLARQHVPHFLRLAQPVVADARRVVWVPGVRIHHQVRLTERTRRAVRMVWTQEGR